MLHTVLYLYTRSNNDKKIKDNSKSIENDLFRKNNNNTACITINFYGNVYSFAPYPNNNKIKDKKIGHAHWEFIYQKQNMKHIKIKFQNYTIIQSRN